MKNTLKLISILCLTMLALACSKDKSEEVAGEERWLRITYEGDSIWWGSDSINITGWKPGEETVYFWDVERGFPDAWVGFYYSWQGEDSIDYCYDEEGFLWVNGKLVAGNYYRLKELEEEKIKNVNSIRFWYPSSQGYCNPSFVCLDDLARFTQLSLLDISVGYHNSREAILDSIRLFPENLMLRIRCNNPTNENIGQLLKLPNLFWLEISLTRKDEITNAGLLRLGRAKQLKKMLLLRCPEVSKIKDKTIQKLQKKLPNCDIHVSRPWMVTLPPERLTLRQWFFRYVLSIRIIRQVYVALFT